MANELASYQDRAFHVVYFDQKNAFDRIKHGKLICKLHALDIYDSTVKWIESFLSGRTFRVKVGSVFSSSQVALCGSPQGSTLSPPLYSSYILDIIDYFPEAAKYLIYADDPKIWCPIKDRNSSAALQKAINGVDEWCKLDD